MIDLMDGSIHAFLFFFLGYGDHRDLHVLPHSFPPRRASDLRARLRRRCAPPDICAPACAATGRNNAWSSARPIGSTCRSSGRSEEHTSELQSLMRISYAVFCLKKKKQYNTKIQTPQHSNNTHTQCTHFNTDQYTSNNK